MFGRAESSSSDDNEKKGETYVERRGSKASVHSRTEDLHDLPDPDQDKTAEERKKIDRALLWKVDRGLIPWLCLLYLVCLPAHGSDIIY